MIKTTGNIAASANIVKESVVMITKLKNSTVFPNMFTSYSQQQKKLLPGTLRLCSL